MHSNLKKGLFIITLAGSIMSQGVEMKAADRVAEQIPEIGIEMLLDGVSDDWFVESGILTEDKGEYSYIAFANVDSFLYMRSEPTEESEYVGKLYQDAAMEISEFIGEWVYVSSGEVKGYVNAEHILCGEEAQQKAEQMLKDGEEFTYAESREAEEARLQAEAEQRKKRGEEVVSYACQFIGNPYVWGGTSLTNGADCSGFVQAVFADFGIALPRTSSQQRSVGVGVSYSEAQPGDIICYQGHVGIYIGNGQIVNAMTPAQGIAVCSANYAPIVAVRRVL